MKLSTKGRYAMVALADLAGQPQDVLLSLSEISKRQDISLPYLEQLFVKLRRAGLRLKFRMGNSLAEKLVGKVTSTREQST